MPTPTGPIALSEDAIKTTLADCASFRTLVDADTRTKAASHIYADALPAPIGAEYTPDELKLLRPCAMIWTVTCRLMDNESENREQGVAMIRLYVDTPKRIAHLTEWVGEEFRNVVGDILADFRDLRATSVNPYLSPGGSQGVVEMTRIHPDQYEGFGDCQWADIQVEWSN